MPSRPHNYGHGKVAKPWYADVKKMEKPAPHLLRKDIFAHVDFVINSKALMLQSNDKAAKRKCWWCDGTWHFRLAPARLGNMHIHGACDGTCGRSIQE